MKNDNIEPEATSPKKPRPDTKDALRARLAEKRLQLEAVETDRNYLTQQLSDAMHRMEEIQSKYDESLSVFADLKQIWNLMKSENIELRTKLEEKSEAVVKLGEELTSLKMILTESTQQDKGRMMDIEELSGELKKANERCNRLCDLLDVKDKLIQTQTDKIAALETRIDELKG